MESVSELGPELWILAEEIACLSIGVIFSAEDSL